MELPANQLTPLEISDIISASQASIADWEVIKTSITANEFSAYRERLSHSLHGLETILDVLEGQQSELKNKTGFVKLQIRNVKRHDDLARDKYWSIRKGG